MQSVSDDDGLVTFTGSWMTVTEILLYWKGT